MGAQAPASDGDDWCDGGEDLPWRCLLGHAETPVCRAGHARQRGARDEAEQKRCWWSNICRCPVQMPGPRADGLLAWVEAAIVGEPGPYTHAGNGSLPRLEDSLFAAPLPARSLACKRCLAGTAAARSDVPSDGRLQKVQAEIRKQPGPLSARMPT